MAQVEEKVETRTIKNYVGGGWIDAEAGERLDVTNPATGETLAQVPLSGADDVDAAVRAAREAFPGWRATPPLERARACFELKYRLEERRDDLAALVTRDNGKAIKDAAGEIRRGIECVEVATGIPSLMQGANLEDVSRGIDSDMIRQPIGVFAGITPFNFPFMVPLWFLPFAIACGNTFILKPSEQDPLAMELTFELLDGIDLPPGVVNLVNGGKDAVNAVLEHPGIDGVSFVGSTQVAHYIYETAAKHGKRVQALGGAKNHVIVMPDAELESAVDGVLSSAFHAAGQRCLANSVCVAVGDVYESLRERLAEKGGSMVVGDGSDETTEVGPVISPGAHERILGWIDKGVEDGGEIVLDGRGRGSEDGSFIGPTIIAAEPDAEIAREEIFGPVLTLLKARDLDHALEILNASTKGNAASIFTTSGAVMRKFRYEAQAGMLGVNIGVAAPMSFFPFTGWKDSFFGDLHAHGRDAIDFYTEKKVVITRWPKTA
ncbi:MAG TPA: CoA-acylating methylmalonate-semialdehyde dehydrogenase [Gaiellaceae bacterium]|jgi:malonate-semialdehyde dehydrogenase (acetylating)/methylmalonate-semialdehyde dehydrogenase|nr:CoA-acylating methylmalonate-semialdehyde dehydrogenase [Gaiellaceae bacterium]